MSRVNMKRYLALLILLSSIVIQPCNAADDNPSKLKTVYLVNFARFINWQHIETTNVNLCIYKDASIYSHTDKINNINIGQGRKLTVLVDPEDISLCNILYWDEQTIHLRDATATNEILEVTDSRHAFNKGMDVLFFLDNNKLRFFITDNVLNAPDIKISSKLLRLSKPPSDSGGMLINFIEHAICFIKLQHEWIGEQQPLFISFS